MKITFAFTELGHNLSRVMMKYLGIDIHSACLTDCHLECQSLLLIRLRFYAIQTTWWSHLQPQ